MWREVATDLWCLEDTLTLPGGVVFPVRATAVRLADGGVWLHSPIGMDDEAVAQLRAIGPVRDLVAPCALHHLFLEAAVTACPDARVWGPASLPTKRTDLAFTHTLGVDDAPWADALASQHIDGVPWVDEHVFFHAASGSLLCADLVFHITDPATWQTRLMTTLAGVLRRFGQSRLYRFSITDTSAAAASARAVLQWPIERVVMCHGEVLETNAHAALAAALQPMIARG